MKIDINQNGFEFKIDFYKRKYWKYMNGSLKKIGTTLFIYLFGLLIEINY